MFNFNSYTTPMLEHWAADRCGNCSKWNNPHKCYLTAQNKFVELNDRACKDYEPDQVTCSVQKELTFRRMSR